MNALLTIAVVLSIMCPLVGVGYYLVNRTRLKNTPRPLMSREEAERLRQALEDGFFEPLIESGYFERFMKTEKELRPILSQVSKIDLSKWK